MAIRSILVTGGAGYIGSHLVDRLVSAGLRRHRARQSRAAGASQRHVAVVRERRARGTCAGDVRDRAVFEPLVLASDAVVHFGAAVSVGQSMYQVDRYVDVNTRGTALLLDILVNAKHNVAEGARRLLDRRLRRRRVPLRRRAGRWRRASDRRSSWRRATGSSIVRDAGAHVASIPTPEDKALYRDNIYSMTKYHQEEMVLLIGKTYGIPAVAPRFFNVYGPRQSLSNPYAGVAAIWLSRLLNGKQPVVFEDGGQLRDFVSIHDVVDCLVLMLEKSGADFLPVNVGVGRDRHDPRHREAAGAAARNVDRAAGDAHRAEVRHPPQHRRHHARADDARLRAEGDARAGVRRADRMGARRRPDRRGRLLRPRAAGAAGQGPARAGDRRRRDPRGPPTDRHRRRCWSRPSSRRRSSIASTTLGGALGGFTNDEFGYLARARQIQAATAVSRLQRSWLVSHGLPVRGWRSGSAGTTFDPRRC